MLDLYRRHSDDCSHKKQGRKFTACRCPIWATGELNDEYVHKAVRTRSWATASRRTEHWEANPAKAVHRPSLAEAIKIYLDDCRARRLAAPSIESYEKTLGHLAAFRKEARVDELDLDALTQFRIARG